MDAIILELIKLFPKLNAYAMTGLLVMARLFGFFRVAPIFCRKEIPSMVKIPIAMIITVLMVPLQLK